MPASPLEPSSSPIAWVRIVLPAPVSPVIAVSPAPGARSPSRTSTRFSIRRLRSKGPAVAAEERHLGQAREERALLPEPGDRAAAGAEVADLVPVDESGRRDIRRPVPDDQLVLARHDERPRVERVRRHERDRHRLEPPDEDGAAVGEVVARRSGGGRADDAVASEPAEPL